jgi:hypothetical protein
LSPSPTTADPSRSTREGARQQFETRARGGEADACASAASKPAADMRHCVERRRTKSITPGPTANRTRCSDIDHDRACSSGENAVTARAATATASL